MKLFLLLLFSLANSLFALTCPSGTTHIVDALFTQDGITPVGGKNLLKGPSSPSGSVLSTSSTITIGAGGVVDFCLVGGVATKYTATYLLTSVATHAPTNSYSETWIVPATSSVLAIKQLWGGSAAPQYLVSPAQINASGLADGNYCFAVAGQAVTGMTACGGGGSSGDGTWGGGAGGVTTWGGN
jgi:hypothetical protein